MWSEVAAVRETGLASFVFQPDMLEELGEAARLQRVVAASVHKRNTKSVGDISELRVLVALSEAGYVVSKPLGENQRYDLIADDGERLYRIQVKTGRIRRGVVLFSASSTHAHRGRPQQPYRGQVDFIGVYCPESGKVYLVPESQLTASLGSLRLAPTKNNVAKTVRWADQYELLA